MTSTIVGPIKDAWDELERAKAMKCICSGFTIQYEGSCQCEKGKAKRDAKKKLEKLLKGL